jgi:hypothetical protein
MPLFRKKPQAALRTADAAISLSLSRDEWEQIMILLRECAVRHDFPKNENPLTILEEKIRHGIYPATATELPSRKTPSED